MFSDKLRLQLKIGGAFTFSEKLFSFSKQLQTLRLKKVQENHSSDFRENPSSRKFNLKNGHLELQILKQTFDLNYGKFWAIQVANASARETRFEFALRRWSNPQALRERDRSGGIRLFGRTENAAESCSNFDQKYLLESLEFSLLFLFWISFTFLDVYCKQCGERTGTLQVGRSLRYVPIQMINPKYGIQSLKKNRKQMTQWRKTEHA